MDLSARKLIAHDDDDFEENGLAASFIFDPEPASARGLSVSLRQDAGKATGGVDALFMPEALRRQEGGGTATTAEAAYGLPALLPAASPSPRMQGCAWMTPRATIRSAGDSPRRREHPTSRSVLRPRGGRMGPRRRCMAWVWA